MATSNDWPPNGRYYFERLVNLGLYAMFSAILAWAGYQIIQTSERLASLTVRVDHALETINDLRNDIREIRGEQRRERSRQWDSQRDK